MSRARLKILVRLSIRIFAAAAALCCAFPAPALATDYWAAIAVGRGPGGWVRCGWHVDAFTQQAASQGALATCGGYAETRVAPVGNGFSVVIFWRGTFVSHWGGTFDEALQKAKVVARDQGAQKGEHIQIAWVGTFNARRPGPLGGQYADVFDLGPATAIIGRRDEFQGGTGRFDAATMQRIANPQPVLKGSGRVEVDTKGFPVERAALVMGYWPKERSQIANAVRHQWWIAGSGANELFGFRLGPNDVSVLNAPTAVVWDLSHNPNILQIIQTQKRLNVLHFVEQPAGSSQWLEPRKIFLVTARGSFPENSWYDYVANHIRDVQGRSADPFTHVSWRR